MMRRRAIGILCAWATACAAGAAAQEWVLGIEELHRLDRLPAFRRSVKVASISSYDRTGGNDDGFSGTYSFVRKEEGGLVIADLAGPGVIYRIWTPTPTDDIVEFRFDGEDKPRIAVPFRDIFTGTREPFVRPLVGYGAGGFFSYVPLPFARSCTIAVKAERVQFYQINYAVYPDDAPIATFRPDPTPEYLRHREKARALFASPGSDISAHVVSDPSAVKARRGRARLEPGKAATIFSTDEPGRIAGIRVSPAEALAGKDRAIVLRAYWDGEARPSINCPAGDFFGYAWGTPSVTSLLVGTASGAAYCYFPMPFDRSARIELAADAGPAVDLETEVLFAPIPRGPGEGRFCAVWRRENPTTAGTPFTFVEAEGRGHIVGCIQQSQGLETGNTYFFEGDDKTVIDGELTIHGTGSEDFYNGGWYDVPGRWETRRCFPLSGCIAYKKHLGRTGGYRLMIGDAYAYGKRIVHTIEHAPTGNTLLNDYAGLTFLYSDRRSAACDALPGIEGRRVVDPEMLSFATWWNVPIHAWCFQNATLSRLGEKLGGEDVRFLSLRAEGRDWFGDPFISFLCEIPARGTYRVSIEAARGPAQGRVQLFRDEAPVAPAVDLNAEERALAKSLTVGTLEFDEGINTLLFKIVGTSAEGGALRFDLRTITCEKVK